MDHHHLQRFLEAQSGTYQQALTEIKQGHKKSHWMWFIFPQFEGLGQSHHSRFYAIKNLEEAKAYLHHPVLGSRLIEITNAVLQHREKSAIEIFGPTDALKLHSSMTLFDFISEEKAPFSSALQIFFNGHKDDKTLNLIGT